MITAQLPFTESDIAALLESRGIQVTEQRVWVLQTLFRDKAHLSADDVFRAVNQGGRHISKATVYNALGLLSQKGVIREVIADPDRIFYDPTTTPHHHFYNVDTGQLSDIDGNGVEVNGLPSLPDGTQLDGVDIIIRLRSAK